MKFAMFLAFMAVVVAMIGMVVSFIMGSVKRDGCVFLDVFGKFLVISMILAGIALIFMAAESCGLLRG